MIDPTEPAYVYRATLNRVIDGDTYVLNVELGFYITAAITVRLHGINCPELHSIGGPEARVFAENKLTSANTLMLRSYKDQRSFARWVADIWITDQLTTTSLATLLVENEHAVWYTR